MEPVSGTAEGLEEKMKKATCEMLALFLFAKREMYVNEVATELERLSGGAFPSCFRTRSSTGWSVRATSV